MYKDIRFGTFRELKEALELIPDHMLDNSVKLRDEDGETVSGGILYLHGDYICIIEDVYG